MLTVHRFYRVRKQKNSVFPSPAEQVSHSVSSFFPHTFLQICPNRDQLIIFLFPSFSQRDPDLSDYLSRALKASATALDEAEMIRFEPTTGKMASTDRGRTASLYYIRYSTASMVKDTLEPTMMVDQLFSVLSDASEFGSMKVSANLSHDHDQRFLFSFIIYYRFR